MIDRISTGTSKCKRCGEMIGAGANVLSGSAATGDEGADYHIACFRAVSTEEHAAFMRRVEQRKTRAPSRSPR